MRLWRLAILLYLSGCAVFGCAHAPHKSTDKTRFGWQLAARLDDRPVFVAGLDAPISYHTHLGLRLRTQRHIDVRYDARLGMPQQSVFWHLSLRQSFVVRELGRWQLRFGAWPQVSAHASMTHLFAAPNRSVPDVPLPWGIVLSTADFLGQTRRPQLALMWGTLRGSVAAQRWAWQGDSWQPHLRCQTSGDCPSSGVCWQQRCVYRYGQSPSQARLDSFALEDGIQVTHVRLLGRQPLGLSVLGVSIHGEHRRLAALSDAGARLTAPSNSGHATELAWRAKLDWQWGVGGPLRPSAGDTLVSQGDELAATSFDTLAQIDETDAPQAQQSALPGLWMVPAQSFGYAQTSYARREARDVLRFDLKQHFGVYRLIGGAQMQPPGPAARSAQRENRAWPYRAYLRLDAELMQRTSFALASQVQSLSNRRRRLHLDVAMQHVDRRRKGWIWQARVGGIELASTMNQTSRLTSHVRVSKGLHLRRAGSLRSSLAADCINARARAVSGTLQWHSRSRAVQVLASGHWSFEKPSRGRANSPQNPTGYAPAALRLGGRYARARGLISVDVALRRASLGQPVTARSYICLQIFL